MLCKIKLFKYFNVLYVNKTCLTIWMYLCVNKRVKTGECILYFYKHMVLVYFL